MPTIHKLEPLGDDDSNDFISNKFQEKHWTAKNCAYAKNES